jgi:hypothetical protein
METVAAYYQRNGTVPPNPFTTLREDIRAHWAAHRPQMYARLQAAGKLEQAIDTAYTLTDEAVIELTLPDPATGQPGLSLLNAFDAVRQNWAFLPTEADVPILGEGEPETWEMPEMGEE